jgi:uncharacterized protein
MHDAVTQDRAAEASAGSRSWSKSGSLFSVAGRPHLFLTNGSRLYAIEQELADRLDRLMASGDEPAVERLLAAYGLDCAPYVTDKAPEGFPVRAISLSVAQKCNLGCTYCYARQGDFGGRPQNMPREIALKSVASLIAGAEPGERVNVAFLGGEPLINREVLRAATESAADLGAAKGVAVGFSITTNGTMLEKDDGAFFDRHGFAVTVSLDGIGAAHDRQRAYKGGRPSYDKIMRRVAPLLRQQNRMQVSARVTVTPRNLDLRETLDHFIALGFFSVGFSPMLSAPSQRDEMRFEDLYIMLDQMIDCGRAFETEVIAGRRYPFLNALNALKEIHKGTHRPYPCGAGAGYIGVSAEGAYFACHRFVDDAAGAMGTPETGVDRALQALWLAQRHVHAQTPCVDCWARYLCGGGCHHEVIHRGRPACDYIRGWLAYCLSAYIRVSTACPEFFGISMSDSPAAQTEGRSPIS